ncbi:lysine N(6)-hydroxylase/L-ornithine N(5)-oxygenase family protein [Bradyrhizobium ontarionense]|uniref:Lysine N(6)-hydroxylase/L-ornithine N(5)-oxygenase family protein n=1 Tax=Bradyrhizobium ontarionense TaxID=2898149 RepID=A0ABY3RBQ9_9BRAD|nr:lysine N(6)-hydroxylase/L-ornithine N(5)-oxygenase family protein [Bradyrhizobium sp. A19]UFZ04835.1 lysine N(6)-hydroxylase/L-ornithine N(5)-oxygenase family protein [Bradyrhizobium sp. A19]
MSYHPAPEYDVVGVGFGPSNLALAIALDDCARKQRVSCRSVFVERQPSFKWHGGMLLPGSNMQISFLKDLVSLRDPTSPFTFINYLHKSGRLLDFTNCRTFYPSRIEFNDYLRWVAGQFESVVEYGETVVAVEPVSAGQSVVALRVLTQTEGGEERSRIARNLVVAVGGLPHIPAVFRAVAGDPRVMHTSGYLDSPVTAGFGGCAPRVAVIGGGQSAAEVTLDLSDRIPDSNIDLIFRGHALKPSDSSPFVNEIFNPEYTDYFYSQADGQREAIVRSFRNTNYAVVDPDLLDQLYRMTYQQRVTGARRLAVHPRSEIVAAHARPEGIVLELLNRDEDVRHRATYDAIVLATGYERSPVPAFLDPIRRYIEGGTLDRDYRLQTSPAFRPQVHLQGCAETSHGLSDTLLSVLPIRAQEITTSLASTRAKQFDPEQHLVERVYL